MNVNHKSREKRVIFRWSTNQFSRLFSVRRVIFSFVFLDPAYISTIVYAAEERERVLLPPRDISEIGHRGGHSYALRRLVDVHQYV